MNVERLRHMIAILEDVERASLPFNLDAWIEARGFQDAENTTGDPSLNCGTACCAVGYAALDPRFRAEGLRLITTDGDDGNEVEVESVEHFNALLRAGTHRYALPAFGRDCQFAAAARFFGIEWAEAHHLFDPGEYFEERDEDEGEDEIVLVPVTPRMVIDRIRALLGETNR